MKEKIFDPLKMENTNAKYHSDIIDSYDNTVKEYPEEFISMKEDLEEILKNIKNSKMMYKDVSVGPVQTIILDSKINLKGFTVEKKFEIIKSCYEPILEMIKKYLATFKDDSLVLFQVDEANTASPGANPELFTVVGSQRGHGIVG